jgi:DNA helicase HerA-like ATPase
MKIGRPSTSTPGTKRVPGAGEDSSLVGLPADAFDDRIAIVGTAGSGKTYAAKGFVERLLESGARVAIVDPLGVWWGLRASVYGERYQSSG